MVRSLLCAWCIAVPSQLLSAADTLAASGWIPLDSGTSGTLLAVHFTDVDRGYAVGAGGLGLRTTDAGSTWQTMAPGVAVDLRDVFFVEDIGVVVGDGGTILRTTDAGSSWATVPSGVTENLRSVAMSGTGGVCGALSQTILYTTDAGATWTISQEGFFGGGFFGAAMLSPDIAFVGGQNSIFQPLAGKSTDGGVTWAFHAFYLSGNEGSIARIDFTDGNTGHAVSHVWDGRGAISRTTNGGQDWTTTLFPNDLHGISFPISDASQVGFVVGAAGTILRTTDAGGSWLPQVSGTAAALRDVHFLDLDNGYVVGDGGVVLKTTTGGEKTTSVDGASPPLTSGAGGVSVRPNPFRDVTELRFELLRGTFVELAVFDVAGRKVRTLLQRHRGGGVHTVSWDGTDDASRPASAGAYTWRLAAGRESHHGTVLLLR